MSYLCTSHIYLFRFLLLNDGFILLIAAGIDLSHRCRMHVFVCSRLSSVRCVQTQHFGPDTVDVRQQHCWLSSQIQKGYSGILQGMVFLLQAEKLDSWQVKKLNNNKSSHLYLYSAFNNKKLCLSNYTISKKENSV